MGARNQPTACAAHGLAVGLALLGGAVLCAAPPELTVGGRVWRLMHAQVDIRRSKHVASVHYSAAPRGAPEHVGPWTSLWATYLAPGEASAPVNGAVPGLEKLFDGSEWRSDEIWYRRGGVERLEKRRYIQARRGEIEFMIWPQDADPVPVLAALLQDQVELGSFVGRHVSKCRVEQDGRSQELDIEAPGTWQLEDHFDRRSQVSSAVGPMPLVTVSFRIEATAYTYGMAGLRRAGLGPVVGAPVDIEGPGGKLRAVTDSAGWVRAAPCDPVSVEPPELPDPNPGAPGDYVLHLSLAPSPVSVGATPSPCRLDGPPLRVRNGCRVQLNVKARRRSR